MTEYEYIDLIISARESLGEHGMVYCSFLFGYLAVAYFVGASLTKTQVNILTLFYGILAPFPAVAAYETSREYVSLYKAYVAAYDNQVIEPTFLIDVIHFAPPFLLSTWLVSVYFMYQIRKNAPTE